MDKLGNVLAFGKRCHVFLTIRNVQKNNTRALSSIAVSNAPEPPWQDFKTNEHNPMLHTVNHIGKYYTIPQDLKNRLYFSGGIPGSLDTLMTSFCETSLLVRKPAVEILSLIKKIDYSNPVVRFVIYGRYGTGKSTSLMHILHYGHASKHLLLHIPWVSVWTKRPKEVVVSQYNEKRMDLPVDSAIWLQHFKIQNADLMKELDLRTSRSYTWSKREITEEGSSLMDIVEHGTIRVKHSSDCVAALLKEIKHHTQFGKFKTMVVIDGVNAFWCKTNVRRTDKTLVPSDDITIVRAFKKFLQSDWKNGVVVTSVDVLPFNRKADMQHPYTPYVLLGKDGFEQLTPFIPVQTENYTDKELQAVLDYYCDRLWIQSEQGRSVDGRKQIRFLSGNNPLEVMKLCDPL